jgi:hypothetical protein
MYQSLVFLISACGDIELISHEHYVGVMQGNRTMPRYANQHVHVADWYVKAIDEHAFDIENESYSLIDFDDNGHVVFPSERRHVEMEDLTLRSNALNWVPTIEQRQHMLANMHHLFSVQHCMAAHHKNAQGGEIV